MKITATKVKRILVEKYGWNEQVINQDDLLLFLVIRTPLGTVKQTISSLVTELTLQENFLLLFLFIHCVLFFNLDINN